jgi:hypothetical protein
MSDNMELDITMIFDTTPSMTPVIKSVRDNLKKLTDILFQSEEYNCNIAIIAHGDYDSADRQYLTKHMDFSGDKIQIQDFINSVEKTSVCWNGGEAYEQALKVATSLKWRPLSKKMIILVGDDIPHPPHFPANVQKVDWEEELKKLTEMDICMYAVQCACLDIKRAEFFYKKLSKSHPSGKYLLLDQFYMMAELISGIFLCGMDDTATLEQHEANIKSSGMYNRQMYLNISELLNRTPDEAVLSNMSNSTSTTNSTSRARSRANITPSRIIDSSAVRVPVTQGRFQRLPVTDKISIKQFVSNSGAIFKPGRGFYEITKPETVSTKKEIIVEHIATGDMFTGDAAVNIIGGYGKVSPKSIPSDYRVFIQSTSYTRLLMPDSWFLYELDQV